MRENPRKNASRRWIRRVFAANSKRKRCETNTGPTLNETPVSLSPSTSNSRNRGNAPLRIPTFSSKTDRESSPQSISNSTASITQ